MIICTIVFSSSSSSSSSSSRSSSSSSSSSSIVNTSITITITISSSSSSSSSSRSSSSSSSLEAFRFDTGRWEVGGILLRSYTVWNLKFDETALLCCSYTYQSIDALNLRISVTLGMRVDRGRPTRTRCRTRVYFTDTGSIAVGNSNSDSNNNNANTNIKNQHGSYTNNNGITNQKYTNSLFATLSSVIVAEWPKRHQCEVARVGSTQTHNNIQHTNTETHLLLFNWNYKK